MQVRLGADSWESAVFPGPVSVCMDLWRQGYGVWLFHTDKVRTVALLRLSASDDLSVSKPYDYNYRADDALQLTTQTYRTR